MASVLVAGSLAPLMLGGGSGAVATAPAAGAVSPVLEKVSPLGTVEVEDDKGYFCATLTVKGSGFTPDVVTEQDGMEVHSSVIRLDAGTEQAMGVLNGAPVQVYPDAEGTLTATFRPCGFTTHGAQETDHVCTQADVDSSACPKNSVGDVEQRSRRWVSTKVWVRAYNDSCRQDAVEEEECVSRLSEDEAFARHFHVAQVSWPLKVTGRK